MLGRLIGVLGILCGFGFGLAIMRGAFVGGYPFPLPLMWAAYLLSIAIGVVVHSLSARIRDSGSAVKQTGVGLVVFGVAALASLWLNARGIAHAREPVQLWLLFATSVIAGVFGIFTSRF